MIRVLFILLLFSSVTAHSTNNNVTKLNGSTSNCLSKHRKQELQRRQTINFNINKLKQACKVKEKTSLIKLLQHATIICQNLKRTEEKLNLELNRARYKNQVLIHKQYYISAIDVLVHFQTLKSSRRILKQK